MSLPLVIRQPLTRPSTFAEATADESATLSPSDGVRGCGCHCGYRIN